MIKIIKNFNTGFSLVEIIVAVAVFLIFLVAVSGLTFGFWKQTRNAVNKERATYLAEEAVEASRNIRDEDFSNLIDGTYGVNVLSNQYVLSGSSDVTDIFTRQITISTINLNQKKIDVLVSWADENSPTNSVAISTYLTDWQKVNLGGGLTILKNVINHGDVKIASDFAPYTVTSTVIQGDPPAPEIVVTPMTLGVATNLDPNIYTVAENTNSNYTTTFSGDCNSSGVVTINTGDAKVCTITNEEKPSQLTVNKTVINHGQSKVAGDFALFVDASPVVSGETNTFDSGNHTVSETADADYDSSFSGDCDSLGNVTLTAGSTKVCTITNEEKRSYLTVTKNVINHGGSAVASDFAPFKIDTSNVNLGVANVVNSGSHTITETNTPNYTQSFSGDCDSSGVVILNSGDSKTCAISNEENLAYVTVNKTVINHGGSATVSTFAPYKVGATEVSLGVSTGINSGTYTVSETTDLDYVQTFSGDCNSGGAISLLGGTSKICTITNEQRYIPTVTSPTSASIASTSAVLGANVTNLGLPAIISARGVCYATTANPITNCTPEGSAITGIFTQSISSLSVGTLYYYRGYATNAKGTAYSIDGTFTTLDTPTITTTSASSIAQTSASSGGNISSDGGASVTARGVVWDTNTNPTIALSTKTSDGTGTGSFTSSLTPLTCNTGYFARAYATNSVGTAYGSNVTFTTTACNVIPSVDTPTSTSIASTSATLGATVQSLGIPATISARGVCYSSSVSNPSLINGATCVSGALAQTIPGIFTVSASSLTSSTLYNYRGYATNTTGTGYTANSTFTTTSACTQASTLVGTPTVYDGNNVSSAIVSKPTGVTTGDIMFAHIMHFNSPDRLAVIPAGWIQLGRHKYNSYNQALYYKVAGASEPVNYTFGLSTNSRLAVTISAYRGCFDTQNPIDQFSNVEYVTNNTTYRVGTVTSSYANSTVLMFPSRYDSTVRTFANPLTQSGGWTEDYDHGNNQSRFSRAGYRKFISSAGVIGVIDSIGTTGSTVKHAFGVVLKPAQ
jgi:prepilin-type N-terminal cleavage/methylation domain-containing protein